VPEVSTNIPELGACSASVQPGDRFGHASLRLDVTGRRRVGELLWVENGDGWEGDAWRNA
jgi:hypothetical protein